MCAPGRASCSIIINNIDTNMGFAKPKISNPATVTSPPPVVTETVEDHSSRAYDQKQAVRRGLLSTILSKRPSEAALGASNSGNSTLG